MPKPPRSDHFPLPVGSNAKPRRGAKLFLSDLGARKINPFGRYCDVQLGQSAILFNCCRVERYGTPNHSYRSPRFNVKRGIGFQSSWKNQKAALWLPSVLPLPAPRFAKSIGTVSLTRLERSWYCHSARSRGKKPPGAIQRRNSPPYFKVCAPAVYVIWSIS